MEKSSWVWPTPRWTMSAALCPGPLPDPIPPRDGTDMPSRREGTLEPQSSNSSRLPANPSTTEVA
jgi:hypothetical protein